MMNELFEKLWKLYPKKVGKSGVSTKAKKEIEKAGEETLVKAIENYKAFMETQTWRAWLDGSTFFNGRWKDYVEAVESFPQVVQKPVEKPKSNFTGRNYDESFYDQFLRGEGK